MSGKLEGKVAVITGASKGIGAELAQRLAREGAKIVVNYSSSDKPALEVVEKLGGSKHAIAVKADVSKQEDCSRLLKESLDKFGKIDILILNAAILQMVPLEKISPEEFDRFFGINVKGPLFLTQEASKLIPDGGRIICFSSSLTTDSTIAKEYLLYNMTKGAIEQMVRVLAKDLGQRSVTVNCINPGPTGTDMFLHGKSEELLKAIASRNPVGRIGKPEEIANVVAFLASSDSSWVNGQVLRVNGGSVL